MPKSRSDYDRQVGVLAAVEDFLFRSKIRATAKQIGVDIAFAQVPGDVLSKARELSPSLIIIDLNGIKTTPIQTIAALKSDPATASIRVLGFVSHIDTAGIEAARQAGADEVLTRGGFAANVAEILRAASSQYCTSTSTTSLPPPSGSEAARSKRRCAFRHGSRTTAASFN